MEGSGPTARTGRRRLVQEIVLRYTIEGDDTGATQEVTLRRSGGGGHVDGVVWSRELMDRLGYVDAQPGNGHCVPVHQRPSQASDGWERRGGQASGAATSAETSAMETSLASTQDGVDCIWLHTESCHWISYC
jgi:hypothetical protein